MSKSYTERKSAWAEKMLARGARAETVRSKDRLPPGQHIVQKLPVLDLGIHPSISQSEWRLQITGLVENPVTLDWPSLMALSQEEKTSDFHCVTTWSKYDCRWRGVPLSALLDLVRPTDEARFVFYRAHDGYTTNTPVDALTHPDALLAHTFDGEPLPSSTAGRSESSSRNCTHGKAQSGCSKSTFARVTLRAIGRNAATRCSAIRG